MLKKKIFTQKIVTKLSKIWVRHPGSEIRDPEKTYSGSRIPDPGIKKAPDPGSGSATLCTFLQYELNYIYVLYTYAPYKQQVH
jgi:hypothetical protein